MTLEELFSALNSIQGFQGKVAYRFFPVGNAPRMPFICYLETSTNNVFADNKTFKVVKGIDIELYTENKDVSSESLIEAKLDGLSIPWNKSEEYIDSEKCYQIVYSVEV